MYRYCSLPYKHPLHRNGSVFVYLWLRHRHVVSGGVVQAVSGGQSCGERKLCVKHVACALLWVIHRSSIVLNCQSLTTCQILWSWWLIKSIFPNNWKGLTTDIHLNLYLVRLTASIPFMPLYCRSQKALWKNCLCGSTDTFWDLVDRACCGAQTYYW